MLKAETYIIKVPANTEFLKKNGVLIIKPTLTPSGNSMKKFNAQKSIIIEKSDELKSKPEIVKNEEYEPKDYIIDYDAIK